MPNPWDVLPIAPQGNAMPDGIYHAVGVALSQWEILESAVADVYLDIVGFQSRAAMAAYGTISSSPGRIDMIVAAAEAVDRKRLTEQEFTELKQLLVNEVGKLCGRRNEIAHGTVTEVTGGAQYGHYLMPPDYNTRKRLHHGSVPSGTILPFGLMKYAYTAAQVNTYGEHFWTYTDKIYDFLDRVKAARAGRGP
jgi:hypothetical protein